MLVFEHINTAKAFTCGKNFDKKYRAAATLISNHNLQHNCSLKKCISKLMSLNSDVNIRADLDSKFLALKNRRGER